MPRLASARLLASASAPTQSSAKSTGAPMSSFNFAAAGARVYLELTVPLGLPRCEASTSRAPRSRAKASVGSVSRIRVSSVTRPPAFERHVEINADKHAFAGEFEVAN